MRLKCDFATLVLEAVKITIPNFSKKQSLGSVSPLAMFWFSDSKTKVQKGFGNLCILFCLYPDSLETLISTFIVNRQFSFRHFQSLSRIGKPVQLLDSVPTPAGIRKDVEEHGNRVIQAPNPPSTWHSWQKGNLTTTGSSLTSYLSCVMFALVLLNWIWC